MPKKSPFIKLFMSGFCRWLILQACNKLTGLVRGEVRRRKQRNIGQKIHRGREPELNSEGFKPNLKSRESVSQIETGNWFYRRELVFLLFYF